MEKQHALPLDSVFDCAQQELSFRSKGKEAHLLKADHA